MSRPSGLRAVWQRLTGLRTPPRGQPSAPPAGDPAAAPSPNPLGKQRRGYSDKAIHSGDYEDKALHPDPLLINPPGPWRVYVDSQPVTQVDLDPPAPWRVYVDGELVARRKPLAKPIKDRLP